jgi:chaperone BCS1
MPKRHTRKTSGIESSGIESHDGREKSKPTTLKSWVKGVLAGGDQGWIKQYIESEFYETARREIEKRTGFDVHWMLTSVIAYQKAQVTAINYIPLIVDQLKAHCSSSVTLDYEYDGPVCNLILTYVSKQQSENSTSWLRLGGRHLELDSSINKYQIRDDGSFRFFWYNGMLMILESMYPKTSAWRGDFDSSGNYHQYRDDTRKLIIRCLGKSNSAIREFIKHLQDFHKQDEQLHVTYWHVDGSKYKTRSRRPLSSIDLEPGKLRDIRQDSERYFEASSRSFYEATGNPYRRGFLLYGPPGTGKTSLSVALASEFNVPLHILNLAGPDDEDLQRAFERLPFRCVALLEDIDCAGVHREELSSKAIKGNTFREPGSYGRGRQSEPRIRSPSSACAGKSGPPGPDAMEIPKPKKVTLSGFLNAIDGACSQKGRLLIMTTNSPKTLDPAIYRPGRVDKIIELGYSDKDSAEVCFRRIFGQDPCRKFSKEAIDRFAKAFSSQFPQSTPNHTRRAL